MQIASWDSRWKSRIMLVNCILKLHISYLTRAVNLLLINVSFFNIFRKETYFLCYICIHCKNNLYVLNQTTISSIWLWKPIKSSYFLKDIFIFLSWPNNLIPKKFRKNIPLSSCLQNGLWFHVEKHSIYSMSRIRKGYEIKIELSKKLANMQWYCRH